MNRIIALFFLVLTTGCALNLDEEVQLAYDDLPQQIDFNFHVKPILSDRCFSCHGPDEQARKADLRLDQPEGATHVLKAGKASGSSLIDRILSHDPQAMMPPPESNLALSAQEKAILVKWVEQGAEWKPHWSFLPIEQPEIPQLTADYQGQVFNEIDNFIMARAQQQGFEMSPEATKSRLLRRVTMDLTGLPPTPDEITSFLQNDHPDAYEQVVDQLLSRDAFAERMAMEWMDVARYADSHGMHADGYRMMWPWRDWVIDAFKENMPYNQFVSWQLAGDMLENASREQILATAFNRNHPMTAEGGAIDEEFRLNYVFDRTETVGTALLGLTLNCARCHDHKFDPISQKDYYQFAAFFNNVKELGMTGDDGNYGPMLALTDDETQDIIDMLSHEIVVAEKQIDSLKLVLNQQNEGQVDAQVPAPLVTANFSDYRAFPKQQKGPKGFYIDGNKRVTTRAEPKLRPGHEGNGIHLTGEYDELYVHNTPNFEWTQPFSGGLWINTIKLDSTKTQTLMGTAGEKNNYWRGWDFYLDGENRLNFRLIHSLPHNYIHARAHNPIDTNQWTQVYFSYDGTGKASGIQLFINGTLAASEVVYDRLYKSAKTVGLGAHELSDRAVRIGKSYRSYTGENGVFKGELDGIKLFDKPLTALQVALLYGTLPEPKKPLQQDHRVRTHPVMRAKMSQLRQLNQQRLNKMDPVPEVMVMEELPQARTAFAYRRGAYDDPIYAVEPGTPEVLPQVSEELAPDRTGLAQWLFDEQNPLTARVTVNRYWQMIFGTGIVNTPHDFGVQGALPTHPQLLDWLARGFVQQEWDLRWLLKKMVLSYTYRQSSVVEEESLQNDPENIYLTRGSTYRLSAEMIRDNALAASGLLVQKMGGESVRPYQPEGLWIEKGNFSHKLLRYKVTRGDSLYRRSLYTFVKRTSPHPAMTAFDAPNRDVCIIKRENTNTPLQALVLLNDPQFVECSKVLAQRVQMEAGTDLGSQIDHAFMLVTGRRLKPKEQSLFEELFQQQTQYFQSNPQAVNDLLTVGDFKINTQLSSTKTAALTVVASTMFNHDEAYMKR